MNPKTLARLEADLLRSSQEVYNADGTPRTRSIAVTTKEQLRELRDVLLAAKIASIDVETWSHHEKVGRFEGGGLAWWHPSFKLASINFSTIPGLAYVLPLWIEATPWKNPGRVLELLTPAIEGVPFWVMQNGKFDEKCLEVMGVHIRQSFDIMGGVYAIDENNRKDLGFLAEQFLGAPDWKEDLDKSYLYEAELEPLVEYGGRDSDYTLRLYPIIKRRLKKEGTSYRLYEKLLHPATAVLTDVELTGQPLHRGKLRHRAEQNAHHTAKYERRIFKRAGHEFNLRSVPQLANVLYNEMGFPVINTSAKGNPSTNESTLLRLADLDETGMMNDILLYRQYAGYGSRYFEPWQRLMDGRGRLHTNFKPYHTVTGRLSSENPNVQQVPRDPFIRGIIGGKAGWSIVEADYAQAELRIAAHYSQDKTLTRIFHAGRDPHTETAMAITGLSVGEITKDQRKKAKSVNFGFLYGMGYKKYVEYAKDNYDLEVSVSEAKKMRRDYFDNYPGLYPWHERQRQAARRRGWVINGIGRKRHLHDINSDNYGIAGEAERQAINSPVQSMATDMILMAMIILHEKLDPKKARIISTVHDSILFEVREEEIDETARLIKETMENLPLEEWFECVLTVPIVADIKVGKFWSEGAKELAL